MMAASRVAETATAAMNKQQHTYDPYAPGSLAALLARVELFQETRSLRTLWLTSRRNAVHLEFSLTHCTLIEDGWGRLEMPWQDVLGAHLLDEEGGHFSVPINTRLVSPDETYVFALFACPGKQTQASRLKQRPQREWLFRFPGEQIDDMVALLTWINYLADPRSIDEIRNAHSLDDLKPIVRPNRKYLVVINPVGGSGRGVQIYENKVAPVFEYAYIDVDVRLTDHFQHGIEIAMQLPLGEYDCVVTIGGDGSLCEFFNGFMKRGDWKDAMLQPVGIVPSGSGNGLFASLMHDLGEHCNPHSAAFVLAKGMPRPLDLTGVRNPYGDVMYSFLSLEWALIADVDVDSENLRVLGGARFGVMFFRHVFLTRTHYTGTVWYLEEPDVDEVEELKKKTKKKANPRLLRDTSESEDRPTFDLFDKLEEGAPAADGSNARWRKIDGGFHIVWAMNVTHAASDAHVAPGAGLNDGYNYIMLLETEHPRRDLVNLLLQLEQGTHFETTPNAKCIKTRAYRFVSDRPDDVMCVDGEVFKGPVDAQVFHNLARIMALPSCEANHDSLSA